MSTEEIVLKQIEKYDCDLLKEIVLYVFHPANLIRNDFTSFSKKHYLLSEKLFGYRVPNEPSFLIRVSRGKLNFRVKKESY